MASDEEEEPPANVQRRKQVTSDQRKQIISALTTRMEEGAENCALKYGSLKEVAILFDVSQPTVTQIWKRARDSFKDPAIQAFRASPVKKCGRPVKWSRDDMRESI
jgi:hypothetical protein